MLFGLDRAPRYRFRVIEVAGTEGLDPIARHMLGALSGHVQPGSTRGEAK
jgi:hypothetical protein